jgi:hypothetical protein
MSKRKALVLRGTNMLERRELIALLRNIKGLVEQADDEE